MERAKNTANMDDEIIWIGVSPITPVQLFMDLWTKVRECNGFELSVIPFCCAMAMHHPLAGKEKLTLEDLYGQQLLLMQRGWSCQVDWQFEIPFGLLYAKEPSEKVRKLLKALQKVRTDEKTAISLHSRN